MHQISLQQLCRAIPRPLPQWSTQDVCTWFQLNDVEVDAQRLRAERLTGPRLLDMGVAEWMRDYGLSKFIARRVVEWVQDDSEEFHQLLLELLEGQNSEQGQQNKNLAQQNGQAEVPTCKLVGQDVTGSQKPEILFEDKQYQLINYLESESKALQQPIQDSESSQSEKGSSDDDSNSDLSSDGGDVVSIQEVKQHQQVVSKEKKSSVDEYNSGHKSLLRQFDIEKTQKVHKKIHEANRMIRKQTNKQKQISIYDNQSILPSKWAKRKFEDSRPSIDIDKNKGKNNQVALNNKEPRIYNYFTNNVFDQELLRPEFKKISSAEQLPSNIRPAAPFSKLQQAPILKFQRYGDAVNEVLQLTNPSIKFAESQYNTIAQKFIKFERVLRVKTGSHQQYIDKSVKIGRAASNEVNLTDESVSRSHAEVIQEYTPEGIKLFYLKDVGSKFGTFIQTRQVHTNLVGKTFLIGETEFEILSIEASKQVNSSTNLSRIPRHTLDARLRIDKEKQVVLNNKAMITFGKKAGVDVKLDGTGAAKIWVDRDRKVYLEASEGTLYIKIRENMRWNIEDLMDSSKKLQLVFGWLKTSFEMLQFCKICSNSPDLCHCDG